MSENAAAAPAKLGLGKSIIIGLAGLFYAYAVWNAVAYLLTVAPAGINAYGWFVLIFSVLFPVLVFAIALGLGRRRSMVELAITLVAGLGLVAVFWMNVAALSLLTTSFLIA